MRYEFPFCRDGPRDTGRRCRVRAQDSERTESCDVGGANLRVDMKAAVADSRGLGDADSINVQIVVRR